MSTRVAQLFAAVLPAVAAAGCAASAPASVAPRPEEKARPATQDFDVAVEPYLWAASVDGNVRLGSGGGASVGADFDELLDDLEAAAMLAVEARFGNGFGLLGDITWFDLEDEGTATGLAIPVEGRVGMFHGQLSGLWRPPGQEHVLFDVLAGVRVIDIETEMRGDGPFALNPQGGDTFVDPVVGARATVPLGEDFQFLVLGDIGGFGVGTDLSYQVFASVGWAISRHVGIGLGWRHLGVDFSESNMSADFDFTGPLLGMRFAF